MLILCFKNNGSFLSFPEHVILLAGILLIYGKREIIFPSVSIPFLMHSSLLFCFPPLLLSVSFSFFHLCFSSYSYPSSNSLEGFAPVPFPLHSLKWSAVN